MEFQQIQQWFMAAAGTLAAGGGGWWVWDAWRKRAGKPSAAKAIAAGAIFYGQCQRLGISQEEMQPIHGLLNKLIAIQTQETIEGVTNAKTS